MRRLIIDLLIAHVVASYGMVLGFALVERWPPAEAWLLAPVLAPAALWEIILDPSPKDLARPRAARAAMVGGYATCLAGMLAWRRLAAREPLRKRRRRRGLCTECGYDLTGNASGKCPECGVPVSPRARLLLRRER